MKNGRISVKSQRIVIQEDDRRGVLSVCLQVSQRMRLKDERHEPLF